MENEEDCRGSLEDDIDSGIEKEADNTADDKRGGAENCQAYFGKIEKLVIKASIRALLLLV